MSKTKWTKEKIHEVALKYTSRKEFQSESSNAYMAAYRLGVLKEVTSHMPNQFVKWNAEDLRIESSKYKTRSEFKRNNYNAYFAASRRGLLEEFFGSAQTEQPWTYDELIQEAKKYSSRSEFYKNKPGAYTSANGRGLLDQICSHMKPKFVYWTDEMLRDEASKYTTRWGFGEGSESAYKAAIDRGILDDICSHMQRGKSGLQPHKPAVLYILRLSGMVNDYIGFGVTNNYKKRIRTHTKSCRDNGFTLELVRMIDFDLGKDAASLEKILKQDLSIVNTGIEGFKTEAILAKDHENLNKIVDDYMGCWYNSKTQRIRQAEQELNK